MGSKFCHFVTSCVNDATICVLGFVFAGGEVAVKQALEDYVKAASFVLLRLKMRHHYGGDGSSGLTPGGGFKFFCMYAFLDKFVEQCPQVRDMPYPPTHSLRARAPRAPTKRVCPGLASAATPPLATSEGVCCSTGCVVVVFWQGGMLCVVGGGRRLLRCVPSTSTGTRDYPEY